MTFTLAVFPLVTARLFFHRQLLYPRVAQACTINHHTASMQIAMAQGQVRRVATVVDGLVKLRRSETWRTKEEPQLDVRGTRFSMSFSVACQFRSRKISRLLGCVGHFQLRPSSLRPRPWTRSLIVRIRRASLHDSIWRKHTWTVWICPIYRDRWGLISHKAGSKLVSVRDIYLFTIGMGLAGRKHWTFPVRLS